MAGRKASIFVPMGSLTSISGNHNRNADVSNLSFREWHMLMQNEHELLRGPEGSPSFTLWKWCYKGCRPCRWFDSIEYNKKICKCCLEFGTFKSLGTILLTAAFLFIFGYSLMNKEILPGGSVFFLFFLFFTSYLAGYIVMLVNLPPMLGNVVIGIVFGNVPPDMLPARDNQFIENSARIFEQIFLVIALIRAGIFLDASRIKNRILFIFELAFFPFFLEFILVWIASHYLLSLPWDWGALEGSVMGLVSLASLTSIMEKIKQGGYAEDKHLSTVLIAASALNVIFSLVLYTVCMSYLFQEEDKLTEFKMIALIITKEIFIGLGVGIVCGLLIAFFPDKRNPKAAILRIIMITIASFAIVNILNVYNMPAAGVIGCLIMCLIASNMWEELGWHQSNNPVQYFYTMAYYLCQPPVLSLIGFTMNFSHNEGKDIGLSISVILIGLLGRELVCFFVILGPKYPTTKKEKIFICISWISKGTFQVLLAFAAQYLVERQKMNKDIKEVYFTYIKCIKRTNILAVLLTTPLVCFTLTFLIPKLLTKIRHSATLIVDNIEQRRKVFKNKASIVKFQESGPSTTT